MHRYMTGRALSGRYEARAAEQLVMRMLVALAGVRGPKPNQIRSHHSFGGQTHGGAGCGGGAPAIAPAKK